MAGFFKVERAFLESSLWLSEPFTRGQAWVDLFGSANHAEGYFFKRGIKVSVLRSQLGKSELTLADRWQWSRNKVRRFLRWLEKEKMISLKQDNKTTTLTVCNYNQYQDTKKTNDTPSETPNDTPERHQKDTRKNTIKKKENNKNVKKKENLYSPVKNKQEFIDHLPESITTKHQMNLILETIEKLIDYCKSSGKTYKDYYAALRNFLRNTKPTFKKKENKSLDQIIEERMGKSKPDFDIEIQAEP